MDRHEKTQGASRRPSPEISDSQYGTCLLYTSSETLKVEFSEIFDTFSGFVWDAIGRVPAEGEKFSIEANGLKIDVENIKNHMVDYAIVRKIPRKKIEKEPDVYKRQELYIFYL